MPKMNPELKAKWVAALRDPSRKQVKGRLRRGDSMCCLGVLCDVIDPARWKSSDGVRWEYGSNFDSCMPPADIEYLVGFETQRVALVVNGRSAAPHQHNDEYNATFLQIADAIEEQW